MIILIQDQTENVATLPVSKAASTAPRAVIYSAPISARAGDIISCLATFEVTNDVGINVVVGRYMTLAAAAGDTAKLEPLIVKAATENVIPDTHHMICTLVGAHQFTTDFDGVINVVAYAASSRATSGMKLTVHQDYGKLDVLMHKAG